MDAYEVCKYLVETWPNRWTGSVGEKESGDWMEAQLAQMGYETRQTRFDCPGWEYDVGKDELHLGGKRLEAGAQYYSVGCDVTGALAAITPDGEGGFSGEVAGKVALDRETETHEVTDRTPMLVALEHAGAKAAILVSEYDTTYSTKMFRTPESKLPAMGVSGEVGEQLYGALGKEVRLVIHARQTTSTTSNVFGEKGPADGPRILVCAHHEASPASPSAFDNASGIGVVLEMAQRFAAEEVGLRLGFVGWGGHEFGVYGSKSYVREYPDEIRQLKRTLVFDGVGAVGRVPRMTAWGSDALKENVRGFAERMGAVFRAGTGRGGGDSSSFVPVGIESIGVGSAPAPGSERVPFHSPMDDMRWIGRKELAAYVELGCALVNEWLEESHSW